MAGSPTFFQEGHVPGRTDTLWKIEQKILGAIIDGGSGGGGGGAGSGLYGVVDPEGSVVANRGTTYTNTSTGSFWVKNSSDGANTGWYELIA